MPRPRPPAPAPRFARRPGARRDELADAALALFGERGFRSTTLDDVAKRAGVSKGTVYLYFDSKDALFRGMVERKIVALIEAGEALVREHRGSAARLLGQLIERMCATFAREEMVRLTFLVEREMIHFPEVSRFFGERVVQRYRRLLRSVVELGVSRGEFRREAIRLVPLMVPSLVINLNQKRLLLGEQASDVPAPRALCRMIQDFVFDGIRLRPTARTPRRAPPRARKKGTR